MARAILKRIFPTHEAMKNNPALKFLGKHLHNPNLFHLNRHSVSVAFFWGFFVALLPIPGQMPVAAVIAILARCNLPIAVALAWITNPLTAPFFLFLDFHVGDFVLQTNSDFLEPQFTLEWVTHSLGKVWKPLVVGSVVCGLAIGTLGYYIVRIFWRWQVVMAWQRRKRLRIS